MTSNNRRLRICILVNFALLISIACMTIFLRDDNDKYFTLGPNENLSVMSVKINNKNRYILLQLFLFVTEFTRVIVNEIASPILGFNIYNPDKKIITEFDKNELQIMANCMWVINSLLQALYVMVTISQIDIAILRVVYSELTTIYTIRLLLNEKQFSKELGEYNNIKFKNNVDDDIELQLIKRNEHTE